MSTQSTPPRRIQTWADWEAALENKTCTEAEKQLVATCIEGRECFLGDGTRPTSRSDENQIGADLLRYLIKGGCDDCQLHDWGVDLVGAYITGEVDLRLVKARGVTGMINCHFDEQIDAMNAKLNVLNLRGSSCPALNAQGVEVKGEVFICDGFVATGEVRLSSAVVGGQLDCSDGSFENVMGHALNAQSIEVKGSVYTRGDFVAKGIVRLAGGIIGGVLDCSGGKFESAQGYAFNAQGVDVKGGVFIREGFAAKGGVSLSGAIIGGQLDGTGGSFENTKNPALNAQGAEVKGGAFIKDGFKAKGEVSFSSAVVGGQLNFSGGSFENTQGNALNAQNAKMESFWFRGVKRCFGDLNLSGLNTQAFNDDAASWAMVGKAYLDGMTYQTLHGPLDAKFRLEWLETAWAYDGSFSPQPYEQLAWTLKRMGHGEQRRIILIEKEKRQRRYDRDNLPAEGRFSRPVFRGLRIAWIHMKDQMARRLVGYGYRPFNFVWSLAALIGIGWGMAHMAYEKGDFAPNSDVILSTADWQTLAEEGSVNPAKEWAAKTGKGRDYESFSSFAYAVDIVIPIVSIGQEAAWAPSTTRGPWGAHLWWLRWLLTVLGWIVTAVGAAAITGIIRRE